MKKVLRTNTILTGVAVIGLSTVPAEAQQKAKNVQLSVGGFFNSYVAIADQADSFESSSSATSRAGYDGFNIYNDSEVHFTGSTKLDNGTGVSVTVELETDQVKNADAHIDDSYLGLTGSFGDVRIGSTDAVTSVFANSAPAAGATGPNDGDLGNSIIQPSAVSATADTLLGTGNSMKLTYLTPEINGFQAGFSYEPSSTNSDAMPAVGGNSGTDTQQYNIGIAYAGKLGSADVSADLSYKEDHGTAANSTSGIRGGVNLTAGQITIGGSFKKIDAIDSGIEGTANSPEEEGFDVGIQYGMGPTSVSLTYLQSDMPLASGTTGDDSVEALTIGASYTVGPGIDLLGTAARVEYSDEGTSDANNNDGWAVIGGIGITF